MLGWGKQKAGARAAELMERVGLDTFLARRYPYQLSGGQRRRVRCCSRAGRQPARCCSGRAVLSAVDPVVRKGLQDELLRIQAELGKTIVFVTHGHRRGHQTRHHGRGAAHRRPARPVPPTTNCSCTRATFVEDCSSAPPTGACGACPSSIRRAGADHRPGGPRRRRHQRFARADPYLLVTDADGRPLGWGTPAGLAAGDTAPDRLLPYGRPFVPGTDSLRAALDCAVLSPTGWAVAVDPTAGSPGMALQEQDHRRGDPRRPRRPAPPTRAPRGHP
ncbi:Proline/glycine betaine ABC transporter ATP-binding protein OS=Streptomyces fumanus OX=67302 GN=GCM10018772_39780 PE=3 SV=1 [Streptomyces fumanus]